MAIRLLCVSTAKNTTDILHEVVRLSSGEIELVLHLGGIDSDIKASALSRMDLRRGRDPHLMSNSRFTGAALELVHTKDFFENMPDFVDHLYRKDQFYAYKSHNLRSIHDYLDYYYILYDALAQRVTASRATHVLFFDVPHQAYDTLIWQIAKAMNLSCLILSQASHFEGKFFSMRSLDDYGLFTPPSGKVAPYPITPDVRHSLFYMKGVGQGESQKKGHLSLLALGHIFLYLVLKKPKRLLELNYLKHTISRAAQICKKFPDWRDPFAGYFHENELAYFEHLLQYEGNQVDLSVPYVYFPLHLQPEATTSSLGGLYRDQALAIETLATIIPSDMKIYVKENPRQRSYMRGPLFFHRLKRIPNVEILPSFVDTHDLLINSEFVATVTGTIGWEAICNRKKCLAFGRGWFRSLPGVICYNDKITYDLVKSYTFSIEELRNAVGALLHKCHDGVIQRHHSVQVSPTTRAKNTENVARCVEGLLLNRKPVTFEAS